MRLDSLISGIKDFQLIYVSLRLGIPSLLSAGPRGLDDLVRATHVPEERLVRLLRGLIWAEVLTPTPAGFALTEEAEKLIDDSPGSIAGDILFQGHFFYASWGHLHEFAASGASPFETAHGERVFDKINRSPELARLFNRSMSFCTAGFSATIAELPVFTDCGTVVDVAGGEGRLALDLLAAYPAMRGVVFDLPVGREDAERLIRAEGMDARCEFVAGDMFAEVPSGGDVYLLKWILHDWDDRESVRILRQIRKSVGPTARLVVIERVMPEAVEEGVDLAEADLNMLCLNGGAERSEKTMTRLLQQAGFALESLVKLEEHYGFHAYTAAPVEPVTGG